MSKVMKTIVVAVSRNGIIGSDGGMPWRLSTDLKRFKALTLGKPVIMGRKTFQTIGKPLPGRPNVVITRDKGFSVEGVRTAHSLDEAIEIAATLGEQDGTPEICIIGGGEIYRQSLAVADRPICHAYRNGGRGRYVLSCHRSRAVGDKGRVGHPCRRKGQLSHPVCHIRSPPRLTKSNYFPINPSNFLKLR